MPVSLRHFYFKRFFSQNHDIYFQESSSSRPLKLMKKQTSGSFIDFKRVKIYAGTGGNGGISFRKLYKEPMGPPNGGTGGKGGDVYIRASKDCSSLNGILNVYKAGKGQDGRGKDLNGSKGKDVELVLPLGTSVRVIHDLTMNENQDQLESSLGRKVTSSTDEALNINTHRVFQRDVHQSRNEENDNEENEGEETFLDMVDNNTTISSNNIHFLHQNTRNNYDEQETAYEKEEKLLANLVQKHYLLKRKTMPMLDRLRMLASRIPPPTLKTKIKYLELMKQGETHLLAKGGRGGLGNPHFQRTNLRGPAFALKGEIGHAYLLELELKTLADAGLVGLPNAGKSTFLSAVSRAHPKIAPYPFTTLNPYVGTIDYPDFFTLTLADIPGLVPGAHLNVGLGHAFLRHVERSRILVYVIDLSSPNPLYDFEALLFELEAYKKGLTQKPSMIVANKADLGEISQKNLSKFIKNATIPIIPISAKEGKNVVQATAMMRRLLSS